MCVHISAPARTETSEATFRICQWVLTYKDAHALTTATQIILRIYYTSSVTHPGLMSILFLTSPSMFPPCTPSPLQKFKTGIGSLPSPPPTGDTSNPATATPPPPPTTDEPLPPNKEFDDDSDEINDVGLKDSSPYIPPAPPADCLVGTPAEGHLRDFFPSYPRRGGAREQMAEALCVAPLLRTYRLTAPFRFPHIFLNRLERMPLQRLARSSNWRAQRPTLHHGHREVLLVRCHTPPLAAQLVMATGRYARRLVDEPPRTYVVPSIMRSWVLLLS